MRVGGRLVNAPIGDERKHPIILPYKHHVTDLIIKQCHENLGHMGQESVLSSLREAVWIVKAVWIVNGREVRALGTSSWQIYQKRGLHLRSHLSPMWVLIILDHLKLSKEDPVLRDMAVSSPV